MIAVDLAGAAGKGFVELCQEGIQVFDFQRGKVDAVFFKIPVQGGQHSSCQPEIPLGKLSGLLKIEQVLFIDVGQLNLVVWNLKTHIPHPLGWR
jgi:hypothetical protein